MIKKILLISIVGLLSVSCGKKINKSDGSSGNGDGGRGSQDNDIGETLRNFIAKQTHQCSDDLHCQESIAKLVVIDRQNIRYCTGTLVGKDVILTSSSCLPKTLRVPSLNCGAHIFAIFPETTFLKQETIGCKSIVSSDTNEDVDPALWRSDFAFIKLSKTPNRKKIKLSNVGLKEDVPFRSYKVDFSNDYDGYQKLSYCFPVHNTYANPFSSERFSPMVTVRDCKNIRGNAGAPLMDFSGKIVGVFSGDLDDGVGSYVINTNLLIENMAPLHHVANTACVRLPKDLLTTQLNPECSKEISMKLLDKNRRKILKSPKIHQKNMENIKFDLENPVKYFKWNVKFYVDSKGTRYEPHFVKPKCFFDIDTWVSEFTRWGGRIREWTTVKVDVPNFVVETKLDRKLKPVSFVTEKGEKTYSVSFNPRYAYNMRNTVVHIKASFQGKYVTHRYDDVTDACQNYWE